MESILSTFGIDWRLLLVNIVNFALLLGGLWYFMYGPIMRMLEERRQKVTRGVEDAEAATRARQEIEGERSGVLAKAAQEADEALARARAAASARERELVEEAGKRAEAIVAQAEAQAKEEKARAIAESRDEVAKLIVLGMQTALSRDNKAEPLKK
jgi:F-type H+-transporting ATPase subunit b